MDAVVGIDLGTTYSAVAYVDEHGRPAMIPISQGTFTMPSAVCFRDGDTIVGQEAKDLLALGMHPGAMFFKRAMGNMDYTCPTPSGEMSAEDLSALILRSLKEAAERHLGRTVSSAVITVPAYFRDPERKATIRAGEAAGLKVLRVINEPTAAALAHGLDRAEEAQRLLVYDLGGGTFDITLLESSPSGIKVISSDGDHELGGKDWDDRLITMLASWFEDEFGSSVEDDPASMADLRSRCEEAKQRLSGLESVSVTLVHSGSRGRYEIQRTTFEDVTRDLMERTVALTRELIDTEGFEVDQIDDVVLVGGSTRMPMVTEFIQREFGRPPVRGPNVDESVALGAALAAHQLSQKSTASIPYTDVTNHSLGMIALNEDRSEYINSIILPKNRQLPCIETRPFQHQTQPGDNSLEIFVTQGESESPADVAFLGRYEVRGIPHQANDVAVLDIEYQYGVSGTVDVTCRIRGSEQELELSVEPLRADARDRFMLPPQPETTLVHKTAHLAFDLSGSMMGSPLEDAKKAAIEFLQNSDLTHTSLGIIGFSDRVAIKLSPSHNAREIEKAIRELTCGETGGGNDTDPFDDILKCSTSVEGSVFAIVLADGVWYNQERAIARAKACHDRGIDVIAIGFGGADKDFLREIASCDEAAFYTTQENLVSAFSAVAQVLTESGDLQALGKARDQLAIGHENENS